MTDPLISKVEQHAYRLLFLHDLHWSAPDHPPIDYTADGRTLTATNVSSYKGLRVWVCDEKPGSQLEAQLDREIAKTSTDRLVIFHSGVDQVWRWPVRRNQHASTTTRLTSHRHRSGAPNPKFAARLDAIRLPLDVVLDPNAVLAKVRAAFDVEAQNETKHASKLMARMYAAMEKAYQPGHDQAERDHQISVTLARILFLMFGDDTDMWAADLFRDFIHHHTSADGSNIGAQLNHLFVHLDTEPSGHDKSPLTSRTSPTSTAESFDSQSPSLRSTSSSAPLSSTPAMWTGPRSALPFLGPCSNPSATLRLDVSWVSTTPPKRTSSRPSTRCSSMSCVPTSNARER